MISDMKDIVEAVVVSVDPEVDLDIVTTTEVMVEMTEERENLTAEVGVIKQVLDPVINEMEVEQETGELLESKAHFVFFSM